MTSDYFLACILLRDWLTRMALDRFIEFKLDMMGIPKDPGEQELTA